MLLNEEQKRDIFFSYYDSSNILMSKYIFSEKKLSIIFRKGHQYVYENVIPYHYQRFKTAQSQGKALSEHIIKNYKSYKADIVLDKETIESILKDIEDLKNKPII